jgi:hypothetical protein
MDKAEGRLNKAEELVQSMTEELKLWYEYHIPGMPYTTSAPVQACNLSGPKSEKLSPLHVPIKAVELCLQGWSLLVLGLIFLVQGRNWTCRNFNSDDYKFKFVLKSENQSYKTRKQSSTISGTCSNKSSLKHFTSARQTCKLELCEFEPSPLSHVNN